MIRKPFFQILINKSWRRFGYVILIVIKFGEVLLWFSPRIINSLRGYIKHSKECFIFFSTHFLVFGYLMKHSSSCLIYYLKNTSFKFFILFFCFFSRDFKEKNRVMTAIYCCLWMTHLAKSWWFLMNCKHRTHLCKSRSCVDDFSLKFHFRRAADN